MDEVARRNDFAVIGAGGFELARIVLAPVYVIAVPIPVTLSMTLDCRNARWRLPRYKSAAESVAESAGIRGRYHSIRQRVLDYPVAIMSYDMYTRRKRLRGNETSRSEYPGRDAGEKRNGPIDTMAIRLKTPACN